MHTHLPRITLVALVLAALTTLPAAAANPWIDSGPLTLLDRLAERAADYLGDLHLPFASSSCTPGDAGCGIDPMGDSAGDGDGAGNIDPLGQSATGGESGPSMDPVG